MTTIKSINISRVQCRSYRQGVPDDRKKGTGVRRVSTQKYHIIVTVEAIEFIQTSTTTVIVNIVVSISTN